MVTPHPSRIHAFESAQAFEAWLRKHHGSEPEVYLRVYKAKSGIPSIQIADALDLALCFGWIDGVRKAFDRDSYLQRYSPRRAQSPWSKLNREHAARLIAAGRMTPAGLAEIERAKADGRWERAYAGSKQLEFPDDLLRAIRKDDRAHATYRKLDRKNLFALAFRLSQLKTDEGRKKKIAAFVAMLAKGEAPHPIKPQK
jgi:uncharacterized protein YdeI (YjbR/CyaY-like superfamily)